MVILEVRFNERVLLDDVVFLADVDGFCMRPSLNRKLSKTPE